MKMTVITREDGSIAATQQDVGQTYGDVKGGLAVLPGTRRYEIEVPDDFARIKDVNELHERVKAYLPKR